MRIRSLVSAFALALALSLWGSGALAGPLLGDSDGDGVDDTIDNCIDDPNPGQVDTDLDGCGNACDTDYNQDGVVAGPDFNIFRASFGLSIGEAGYNPAVDATEDDVIAGPDFNIFREKFGGAPGLSGPGVPAPNPGVTCNQASFP